MSVRVAIAALVSVVLAVSQTAGAESAVDEGVSDVPTELTNNLSFKRPDGSPVAFPATVRIFCGRWAPDVHRRAFHVEVGGQDDSAFWRLEAVIKDVRRKPVVRWPNTFVWNKPRGADMFAVDGENELSSAQEEATGRIVFKKVRCGMHPEIRLRIRGWLGSEFFGGRRISVRGLFHARVG